MATFDRWVILRIIEVLLVLACLVYKRVTDDEARSLFLYLQKLSREWSLLTNVTWDRIGSSVADATYGGYLIITFALLMGKIFNELPTERRIMEWIFLGAGSILFISLGSLAFASIDSVPPNLVDNAAILGTLSVVTGALFLLDMGAPKRKKPELPPVQIKRSKTGSNWESEDIDEVDNRPTRSITERVYDIEREVETAERATRNSKEEGKKKSRKDLKNNGIKNGAPKNGVATVLKESSSYIHLDPTTKGYKQMRNEEGDIDIPRRFGIYGKDATTGYDTDETASIPPKIELHTPIWGNIRKGRPPSNYGVVSFRSLNKEVIYNSRYMRSPCTAKKLFCAQSRESKSGCSTAPQETVTQYVISPATRPKRIGSKTEEKDSGTRLPSGPLDPGYVQYTAQHWGEGEKNGTKTPRHSPTEV